MNVEVRETLGSQSQVPKSAATALPVNLEVQMVGSYPRPTESEVPGVGPSNEGFNKLSK